jgi:outer membrane protein OmpA-like peptidoglycan-associated protein
LQLRQYEDGFLMQTKKWVGRVALAAVMCTFAGTAAAQEETRPSGTTFLGDTGLWFVPTAEVLGDGSMAAAGHVSTFNREQGFTAIQSMAGSFAVGLKDRVEVFGSVGFQTRIDRDLRPLFQSGKANVGGITPQYPLVSEPFSKSAFGDVTVGMKANILSERTQAPLAFAVRGWVKLPTGDKTAGTTTGELDGALGIVVSKMVSNAEITGYSDFVIRADTPNIALPNSVNWGFGIGAPVRGGIRVFGEVLGDLLSARSVYTTPLTASDGSISGLSSTQRSPLDLVIGAQWQGPKGFSIGAGVTWAARHASRWSVKQIIPNADRVGFIARVNYHPGVKVYIPPPPPPPPPADAPNRPPTVSVSCDPCEVQVGGEVRLRADASDPDGDSLTYRWSAPTGSFQDSADRVTTQWQAPDQAGPVPINVIVSDGRGGSASDTANIRVNSPPPPAREYVFEDVHFDFDRYSLRAGALRVLAEVVEALEEDADLSIEIEGHTCNIGTNEYNLALGDRRANSVQEYLASRGISGDRLRTVSYGEERSAHDNSREETRRLNRRAAMVVRVQ